MSKNVKEKVKEDGQTTRSVRTEVKKGANDLDEFYKILELFVPLWVDEENRIKDQEQLALLHWDFGQIIKAVEGYEEAIRVQNEIMQLEGNRNALFDLVRER